MCCGKNLVDRAVPAAGDNAIKFSWNSFSNGFAGQSYSISGFPSDPHLHNLAILAQRLNGRSQSSITGRLAVQNNADECHTFRPSFEGPIKFSLGSSLLLAAPPC